MQEASNFPPGIARFIEMSSSLIPTTSRRAFEIRTQSQNVYNLAASHLFETNMEKVTEEEIEQEHTGNSIPISRKLGFVFGGFATIDDSLQNLHRLFKRHDMDLLKSFIVQSEQLLNILIKQVQTEHHITWLNFQIDLRQWISNPSSLPKHNQYLNSSTISFPFVVISQYCELLTLLHTSSLRLSQLNERCTFSAGFSLGLITSYIVSICSTNEKLVEQALSSIKVAFWLGFRLVQRFQEVEIKCYNQLIISEKKIPLLTNLVVQSGSVQISGINHEQIQLFLVEFNDKYGITDHCPFEICVILQSNRVTVGGLRSYMTHLISSLIQKFPNVQLTEIPLDLPVHAHSYFEGVSNLVINDLNRNQIHFDDKNVCHNYCCISSVDGKLLVSHRHTINEIILAIGEKICRWDLVSLSLLEQLNTVHESESLLLIDIGPGVRSRDLINNFKQLPNADSENCNDSNRLILFPLAESLDIRTAIGSFLRQQEFLMDNHGEYLLENSIAIVGMACRFPQSISIDEYFYNLLNRINCISVIPKERWKHHLFVSNDDSDSPYKMKAQHMGIMEDIDMFDHQFFNLNVRDASHMDPQQRLTMECCYLALENAGYVMNEGYRLGMSEFRIGIFVGTSGSDNYRKHMQAHLDAYLPQCGSRSFQAGRVSYFFKFSGPSIQVDTACSASMTCLHLACQAIHARECDAAVVSGVLITIDPVEYAGLAAGGFFSTTGMCKAFSAEADGYTRSDGVAAIVIRPYKEAINNHDFIHSIIRATSINQSGQAQNILLPSKSQISSLMQQCLDKAHLRSSDVQYVEAHATGTQGGDPIETNAIIEVLGKTCQRASFKSNPLYLGSHKAFIGHTEAASGLAGIIKVSMMLQHQLITPHFDLEPNKINPEILINKANTNVIIPTSKQPWTVPKVGMPRCAMVNSFGFSGANGCCLLQETPNIASTVPMSNRKLPAEIILTLSAKHPDSLRALIMRMIQYLTAVLKNIKSSTSPTAQQRFLHSLSCTTTARRTHFTHRIAIVANDLTSLVQRLFSIIKDEPSIIKSLTNSFLPDDIPDFLSKTNEKHVYSSSGMAQATVNTKLSETNLSKRIVFIFGGQGSQYYQMCQELIIFQPSFDTNLRLCSEIFEEIHRNYFPNDLTIYTFLTHSDPASLLDDKQFSSTLFLQPILFSIEYSLGQLFLEWGIRPDFMIGHSFGEIVAACLGNALKLHDALFLIGHRAKLMNSCPSGSMLACNMTIVKLESIISYLNIKSIDISIASHNSEDSIVISGSHNDIQLIEDHLEKNKICRKSRLFVSHAFHSHLMCSIRDEFQSIADSIGYQTSSIPILCNVDGTLRTEFNGEYWAMQIISTVKFHQSIEFLKQLSKNEKFELIFVELSPTPVLSSYIRESQLTSIFTLSKKSSDIQTIYSSVAQLYCYCNNTGVSSCSLNINWNHFYRFQLESNICQVISLPSYVFNSKSLWLKLPWVSDDTPVPSSFTNIYLPQIGECEYRENRSIRHFQIKFPIFNRKWKIDIQNHIVNKKQLFSIPLYISLITQFYTYIYQENGFNSTNIVVEDVMFSEGFIWEETDNDSDNCRTILLELLPPTNTNSSVQKDPSLVSFKVSSIRPNNTNQSVLHANGLIHFEKNENSLNADDNHSSFTRIQQELDNIQNNIRYETDQFYQVSSQVNTYYGPHFQSTKLFVCNKSGLISWTKQIINTNQPYSYDSHCNIYPSYLDSFLQSYGVQAKFIEGLQTPFVAIFIERCTIQLNAFNQDSLENQLSFFTETTTKANSPHRITCSTIGFNEEGQCLIQLNGLLMILTQPIHPVKSRKNLNDSITNTKLSHFKPMILSIICESLECQSHEINCDEDFSSMGIDSLLSIEIRRKAQNSIGISLSYSLLFDYPTVNSLNDHLLSLKSPSAQSTSDDFLCSSVHSDQHDNKEKQKSTGSSIKASILLIICESLECQSHEINCDEDFSFMGIDSLLSIEIRRKVQDTIGMTLSYSLLFDYSTVNSLNDHLLSLTSSSTARSAPDDVPFSSVHSDHHDEKDQETNRTKDRSNRNVPKHYDHSHRPLERPAHLIRMSNVTVPTLASNEPILFMHTSHGRVGAYKELAKIFEELKRPMYGIEAFGLQDNELAEHSMPIILQTYADAIKKLYPNGGKFTIIGYSSAGTLAYLFAIKLLKYRQPEFVIKSIILIDSGAPNDKSLRSMKFNFIDYVLEQVVISSSTKVSKPDHKIVLSDDLIAGLRRVITANLLSVRDYFYSDIPPLYKIDSSSKNNLVDNGDPPLYFIAHGAELGYQKYVSSIINNITLIRASNGQFFIEHFDSCEESLDWNSFLHSVLDSSSENLSTSSSVSIRIHTINANHFNILDSPQVQSLASFLIDNQLI